MVSAPRAGRVSPAIRIAGWVLAIALAAGFAQLGRWQLGRAVTKQAMLAEVAQALSKRHAAPLTTAMRPTGYDWAAGYGHFAPGPLLLLDNQRHGEAVGVRVFAPFLPDAGGELLVDLGWLPVPGNRAMPTPAIPRGEMDLRGLLAPPPSSGVALGADHVELDAKRWLLTRVDLAALAHALGVSLAPRVLRLDPALPIGFARDLDVLPNTLTPERHRGYALQWFGLAALTLAFASFLSFRRPRK